MRREESERVSAAANVCCGKQEHPIEKTCGVSVFPKGRNPALGKHPGPTETVRTASLFPTAAGYKLFGITRGALPYLRPWRPGFLSARGKNWPLCPWQAVFHVARGCGALICPWQLFSRGRGRRICPLIVQPFGEGLAKAQPQQGPSARPRFPRQREARMEAEPGPPRTANGANDANEANGANKADKANGANKANVANDPDRQGRFSHLFHLFSESCYPVISVRKSLRKSPIVPNFVNQLNLDP